MKRFVSMFVMFLVLYACAGSAFGGAVTVGKKTASAVVYAGPCAVTFIKLVEAGADATLTLYNSASATTSGKTIYDFLETLAGNSQSGGPLALPLEFDQGVYAVMTGANAYFFIHVVPR